MQALIALLMEYLPTQVKAIQLLQFVPDAIETVKALVAFVERTIAHLKQTKMLTPEEEFALDALIDEMANKPWWQEDEPANEPKDS